MIVFFPVSVSFWWTAILDVSGRKRIQLIHFLRFTKVSSNSLRFLTCAEHTEKKHYRDLIVAVMWPTYQPASLSVPIVTGFCPRFWILHLVSVSSDLLRFSIDPKYIGPTLDLSEF
jgi:hypothetical protein